VLGADNTSDPKTILQTNTNHPIAFGTNGSERMRIDASGNVGLNGETAPEAPLDFGVTSNNQQVVLLRQNNASRTGFGLTNEYGVRAFGAHDISSGSLFGVGKNNGTTYLGDLFTVQYNGNIGIGTSAPAGLLELATTVGTAKPNALRISNAGASTYYWDIWRDNTTGFLNVGSASGGSLTTRMTINDGNGNVGIGEPNPIAKLEILGGNGNQLSLDNGGERFTQISFQHNGAQEAALWYDATENYLVAHANAGDGFKVQTGGSTDRFIIDSAGHITNQYGSTTGYGQTSGNGGTAIVNDTGSAGGAIIQVTNASRGWANFYVNRLWSSGQDTRFFQFTNSATVNGYIRIASTSTMTYETSSDYRLKENVVYDWDATTRLKQLKPARFNFILDGTDVTQDGFLAHEAQEVVPIAVSGTKDGMKDEEYEVTPAVVDDNGVEIEAAVMGTRSVIDTQGMDNSKLVPLLVKTIQELEARITVLEAG
jgi:hypothetical protein